MGKLLVIKETDAADLVPVWAQRRLDQQIHRAGILHGVPFGAGCRERSRSRLRPGVVDQAVRTAIAVWPAPAEIAT
jgi:hypothetical protein